MNLPLKKNSGQTSQAIEELAGAITDLQSILVELDVAEASEEVVL